MQQIINATDKSLGDIRTLNNQVQYQSSALGVANNSDSGRILMQKFGTWSQDFHQVEGQLADLNMRVKDLRAAGLAASTGATTPASGSTL
jgi:hypothetical protein